MGEIYNMSKQFDFNNLTYYFKDQNIAPVNFITFKVPLNIDNNIKNSNVSIAKNIRRSKAISIKTKRNNYRKSEI